MNCLLAVTDHKMIFDDKLAVDLDLMRLNRVFLTENEYNEEQLIQWLHTYITYDEHEIRRRGSILAHLALNPQNLDIMKDINEKRKLMETSLWDARRNTHPLLIYTHMLNALEAYVSTVDMFMQMFSGSDSDVISEIYQEIQAERDSECYRKAIWILTEMPKKCSRLKNVTLGINMTESGHLQRLALTDLNTNHSESLGLFEGPREGINSLCDDMPIKQHSMIANLEEYIIGQVEKKISRQLRHVMRNIHGYDTKNITEWCEWLKPVEFYIAGLKYLKRIRDEKVTRCLPSFSNETYEAVDMQYPHMVFYGNKPVSQKLRFSSKDTVMITGANSSGKTSCLKSFTQNIILAQLGFPVLAKSFEFSPFKRIVTVFAAGEDHTQNASRYQQEAESIARAISVADKDTLVLLNEPFTSTNPTEACSLICERLIELREKQSMTIIVTHLFDLYNLLLEKGIDNIKSYVMESNVDSAGIVYSYLLLEKEPDGITYARLLAKQYGLDVRKLIPDSKTAVQIENFVDGGTEGAATV